MAMKKIVILSCLLVVSSVLMSGCMTDQQGRPVTPVMRFDPNTGKLYTTYYDGAGRPVVLAPNGVFVPAVNETSSHNAPYAPPSRPNSVPRSTLFKGSSQPEDDDEDDDEEKRRQDEDED
jgi:hypothetical protein